MRRQKRISQPADLLVPLEKAPRQYAWEIYQMKTREERAAALKEVPAELRAWVEFYVRDWFAKAKVIRATRGEG